MEINPSGRNGHLYRAVLTFSAVLVNCCILSQEIPRFDVPKPGARYVNGGTEEYVRITSGAIGELVTKAMAKAGK